MMQCQSREKHMSSRAVRSRHDRWIAGVCGGLGEYFEIESIWLRAGFIFGFLMSGGGLILLYVICAIVMPMDGSPRSRRAQEDLRKARRQARQASRPTFRNRQEAMDELDRQFGTIEEKIRRLEDHVTSRDYVLRRKFEDL